MSKSTASKKGVRGRLKSNSVKAGLGAYAFGIANLILQIELAPEGVHMTWISPSGISIVLLFAFGTYLMVSSVFGHDLSFSDKEAIVKQRQENLPLLRNSIDAIIKRQREVALELGKRPLQSFFDQYLQKSKQYRVSRKLLNVLHRSKTATKHHVAMFIAIRGFFYGKTVCLTDACKDDIDMPTLKAAMEVYYHRNNDKKLSGIIDGLLYAATHYHSAVAFGELGTHNTLSYTSAKTYAAFDEKPQILKGFMARSYKAMNDRIAFLMRGGDL